MGGLLPADVSLDLGRSRMVGRGTTAAQRHRHHGRRTRAHRGEGRRENPRIGGQIMTSEAQRHAAAWEADAIEKCRADPELARQEAAGDLCITCMMSHPCLCDKNATLPLMREFYEANRRTL